MRGQLFQTCACRVNLSPRSGATMTAIGHEIYLYGGQVCSCHLPVYFLGPASLNYLCRACLH